MEYYIQGSPTKAEQIKAAFKELGINVLDFGFADKTVVYCSIGGACVQYLPYSINLMNILYSHPDYRELELTVKPKFKVGDKIQAKDSKMYVYTVLSVDLQNQKYTIEHNFKHQVLFTKQDNFELVPPKPHYDIASFKPFDKVLVRDDDNECWRPSLFGWIDYGLQGDKFACETGDWEQCIPFNEKTKHLLGTTDMCDEQYINW